MRNLIVLAICSLFLGACAHHQHGAAGSATGKASCCAEKEMDCCKDAKAKGKECDKC